MDTSKLKKFAQYARRSLMEQVSVKLKLVLAEGSAARRENASAVGKLEEQIGIHGKDQVIERIAYTWFNRFCALRFMDVNRYTRIGTVSPAEGQSQPEILAEAKMGHMDQDMIPEPKNMQILNLLEGKIPSRDPQSEAYQLLIVAACNQWHRTMPFLFQKIDDFTELLMPTDLLSSNSILASIRDTMTPDACKDVEVIGWLYQFYISEKKDEVFKELKKNKKITPENIPAATQLFTPHWIVRYLVENSLGRLWMLNRPNSKLVEQMDYYIKPEQAETDFLHIKTPEEIKICDPACGSGHMLTYAFDILHSIYEEEGYEPSEIPERILTKNLFGIEIDERAGELSAFALTMKARAKQSLFFRKQIQPNICVLENISFGHSELTDYMDHIGRNLFTFPLVETLQQFEEANNFGSLIRPRLTDVDEMQRILEAKDVSRQLFLVETHRKVLKALRQADYLSPKYHVVIANPPYISGGMNARLNDWVKKNYPRSKSDLCVMFIERNLELAKKHGSIAMITMQSWMFLSSYEALRERVLEESTILSMAHLGERGFDTIGGAVVSTTAFVIGNAHQPEQKGSFLRLIDGKSEAEKSKAAIEAIRNSRCGWFYRALADDFRKIPGSPIAYWVTENMRKAFLFFPLLSPLCRPRQGLATGDNNVFVRQWHEVSSDNIGVSLSDRAHAEESGMRWFPYNKGGNFKKWYGNQECIVDWYNDGYCIRNIKDSLGKIRSCPRNMNTYFRECVSWSKISSGYPAFRFFPKGFIYDVAGTSIFVHDSTSLMRLLGVCNSNVIRDILGIISPTMNFEVGHIASLPIDFNSGSDVVVEKLVFIARSDWDSYETSWDFTSLPLLNPDYRQPTLKDTYQMLRAHWREMTLEMQRLEEENNRIFIDAYGLQDELTPEVPVNEITLTCNSHYRYGGKKSEAELEALLLADTMKEFISYAVGCMFGRYAIEKPGLVLANQGETIDDYLSKVPDPVFPADSDNVIPILDGDWFADDIKERFLRFLKVTFGEEYYEENLQFIEKSIGKDIRKYFIRDFYSDHVKRYKNRPIYWLFSSPKGSFNVLVYMHRYRPDTVSVVLNDYLREFKAKLSSRLEYLQRVEAGNDSAKGEKTLALKEMQELMKMIHELEAYENDVLYPLATKRIELDLDDGVKVNYPKFGEALKPIAGLAVQEE